MVKSLMKNKEFVPAWAPKPVACRFALLNFFERGGLWASC